MYVCSLVASLDRGVEGGIPTPRQECSSTRMHSACIPDIATSRLILLCSLASICHRGPASRESLAPPWIYTSLC